MAPIRHEAAFKLSGQERFAGMPSPGNQNDCRPMAVLLRAVLDRNLTLHPCKVSSPRLFTEKLLIVMDQFGDDTAARDILFIHQNETTGGFER